MTSLQRLLPHLNLWSLVIAQSNAGHGEVNNGDQESEDDSEDDKEDDSVGGSNALVPKRNFYSLEVRCTC